MLMLSLMASVSVNVLTTSFASAEPKGTGSEQIVPVPEVQEPFPALEFGGRNEGNGRFYRDTNPVTYVLRGINDIWQSTTDNWQTTAGDCRRDEVGYKAGHGPNPAGAPNGQPSDYVEPGTEIKDAATFAYAGMFFQRLMVSWASLTCLLLVSCLHTIYRAKLFTRSFNCV